MKIRLLSTSIFLLFFNISGNAQFNLSWNADYSHTNLINYSNESRKVVKDAAHNIFVLSDVTSDIDPNGLPGAVTYHYTVLAKYDVAGTLVNSRVINVTNHSISGFNYKSAFGLELSNNGYVYIGFNVYNSTTNYNTCISKYNTTTLSRQWIWTFNPGSIDQGIDLKIGTGGIAYAIVQSTTGSNVQYHIVKTDSLGTSTAPFFSFDQNLDFLNSMVVDATNDLYVTGHRLIGGIKNSLVAGVKSIGLLNGKKHIMEVQLSVMIPAGQLFSAQMLTCMYVVHPIVEART